MAGKTRRRRGCRTEAVRIARLSASQKGLNGLFAASGNSLLTDRMERKGAQRNVQVHKRLQLELELAS